MIAKVRVLVASDDMHRLQTFLPVICIEDDVDF